MNQNKLILEGIHYSSRRVIRLGIGNGLIYSLTEVDRSSISSVRRPGQLPVIAPGLVDLQINGAMGVDFNHIELLPDQVEKIAPALLKQGVTRFYPTLITGPSQTTSYLISTFKDLIKMKGLASSMLGGIHLEGPFISKEDGPRGAHPAPHCLDPDTNQVQRWQDEAEGMIRIITLAPELPGSEELIKACIKMGMVVSIGHTAAQPDQIKMAVDAGATLSTHLGNGCHQILPRHPNFLWEQLASDELYASMIADGFHLPDSVLKVFIGTKKKKAILVSDGMPYTGMKPGIYNSPATGRVVLTPEGKLHREGNPDLLAGSAGTLLGGVQHIIPLTGFAEAWKMGSVNPSKLMNPSAGDGIQVGGPADLVLLDPDPKTLAIREVYKRGILLEG